MKETYYIGLDVHKDTIAIASIKSTSRAEPTYHTTCGGSNAAVERALQSLQNNSELNYKTLRYATKQDLLDLFSGADSSSSAWNACSAHHLKQSVSLAKRSKQIRKMHKN